jgi:hypothetical protein
MPILGAPQQDDKGGKPNLAPGRGRAVAAATATLGAWQYL